MLNVSLQADQMMGKTELVLTDHLGRQILVKNGVTSGTVVEEQLDLSMLAQGIYTLRVKGKIGCPAKS